MLFCLSISNKLASHQVDFSNAFIHAELAKDEHIYIALPQGFESTKGGQDKVLKLRCSLYGLVQAPLYWGNHLKEALTKVGLHPSVSDPCMFTGDSIIALTYVDDILFFGPDTTSINAKIEAIRTQGFKLTIKDDISNFLGVVVKSLTSGEIEMTQTGLIAKVLAACQMTDCNSKATPATRNHWEPIQMANRSLVNLSMHPLLEC